MEQNWNDLLKTSYNKAKKHLTTPICDHDDYTQRSMWAMINLRNAQQEPDKSIYFSHKQTYKNVVRKEFNKPNDHLDDHLYYLKTEENNIDDKIAIKSFISMLPHEYDKDIFCMILQGENFQDISEVLGCHRKNVSAYEKQMTMIYKNYLKQIE